MNPSASLPEVRFSDYQSPTPKTSTDSAPPNMEDRVTRQVAQDSGVESAKQVKRDQDSGTQRELLDQMIEDINQEYESRNIALKFSIDDKSDSLIIRVMDTTNDKMIRQIPPDEILNIRRRMRALLGDIFDTEA